MIQKKKKTKVENQEKNHREVVEKKEKFKQEVDITRLA